MTKTTTKKKQKLGLTTIIFLALILGVLFGAALCYLVPDSSLKMISSSTAFSMSSDRASSV